MKQIKRKKSPVFRVADHLKVQQQIEKRAHDLYQASCRQPDAAVDDWVRAEREVLQDFIIRRQRSL
jgi:hypothetical protein